ncbi:MAG: dihydropyrimidinase [Chloroflexi bacterium]|nr:dihydropyrimidinase [Chloroflexota bacterium]
MPFDLIVAGGTVVTADGSARADVGVVGGRIAAVDPSLGAADGARMVRADGLLVLPGVVDVHTHTRVATDAQPDRFYQESVAASFGGTTTFLAFNNPGTGATAAADGSLLRGLRQWQAATSDDAAVDYAVSLVITGQQSDPIAELPEAIEAGVPTFKAFMVYDFGVDDATLFRALRTTGRHGGLLQVHCENRTILEARTQDLLASGRTAPRFHAESRPPFVEAEATHRALALARAAEAPVYVVHLSCREALRHIRDAQAEGLQAFAETCPHYLVLSDRQYELPDEDAACFVISPPLREEGQRDDLWAGLADGSLSLIGTDHVPDRRSVEKQSWSESFDRISNGGPGIETLLATVYSEGVAGGRITVERMVDLLSTTPARLFGLASKGAVEEGRDADLVLFDPAVRRTLTQAELHHTSDYTPYEGLDVSGAVRSVFVRGSAVVVDGRFVGRRGYGQFQERELTWR